ncbi:MAG: tetratricopeptide repeat protein [Chitinophagia bacterium]|jgi:tetratricopeptide (TPR) repeat protein
MSEKPYREDRESLQELLKQYRQLLQGRQHPFLEEDDFERIIDYFDEKEQLEDAIEASERGLEQFPYSSHLMIKKADLLLATRKYKEALDILDTASLYDSNDVNLYILKTDAYLALDQPMKAVALLEEALSLFSGEERLDLLFELADVYDDYEEFDKVFDCLQWILEQDPLNEEALYKICFWTDFTGRNEEGIVLHQRILDDHPFSELAWFNLAAAYQGLKLYEKAIDAYQYAVAIDEKFDYAYRNMGDAYLRLRKYREAIEVLEKVLELNRPEEVIYEAIGHCYHKMGNYAQARFHYKKAVHLNADDSKLHYKIAVTYMLDNQFTSAIKHLENAMRIHRNIAEYNLAMGECYLNIGNYKEAIQYLGVVVHQKPRNIAGWEALLKCLLLADLPEEMLATAHQASKSTDGKPIFLYYQSTALFYLGKPKEAIIQLELAIEKAPRHLKKFVDLNPSILRNIQVVDLIARSKKKSNKKGN